MKRILTVLSLAVFLAAGFAAYADDGATLYTRCKGCHGADGSKAQDGMVIKGMSSADLEKAMLGYKAGTFGGAKKAIMVSQMSRLSDEDIKTLADYMAGF
ncbi:MAG: cytochrome c [Desulfovibrio sp.]